MVKKIIISFIEQPTIGDRLSYDLYAYVGDKVEYPTHETLDFEIPIGFDLDETIENTLTLLQSEYTANWITSSVTDYLTTTSYIRIGNKIEVTVETNAPYIRVWRLISNFDSVIFETATPCSTMFMSNRDFMVEGTFPDIPDGDYILRNNDLNLNINVRVPQRIDAELPRGYFYSLLQDGFVFLNFTSGVQSVNDQSISIVIVGNTLTINNFLNQTYRYSIDGLNWQPENVFNDVPLGVGVIYIKDIYGCEKPFNFFNSGESNFNRPLPYHYISESNSIRFAQRVNRYDCGNYKNVFNTLSCEESTEIAYRYTQLFQNCDVISTQVKTSYDKVAFVVDGVETMATKIVSNIGKTDSRDGYFFNNVNGNISISFQTGNIYQYGTTTILGTYSLNGSLPDWAKLGTFIITPYGVSQIVNIEVSDTGVKNIVLDIVQEIESGLRVVSVEYNLDSFDIWEFDIDMALLSDFNVGVRFYMDEEISGFDDVYYLSENISVNNRWQGSTEVKWRNEKNTDVYFFSGIEFKNRLENCEVNTNISDGDIDIEKTDSRVVSISASNYNAVTFKCELLTTGMMRKIRLALKHDVLIINDVPYIAAENPEAVRFGQSNMYSLTCKLIEAGDVLNRGTSNTQNAFVIGELVGLNDVGQNEFLRIL